MTRDGIERVADAAACRRYAARSACFALAALLLTAVSAPALARQVYEPRPIVATRPSSGGVRGYTINLGSETKLRNADQAISSPALDMIQPIDTFVMLFLPADTTGVLEIESEAAQLILIKSPASGLDLPQLTRALAEQRIDRAREIIAAAVRADKKWEVLDLQLNAVLQPTAANVRAVTDRLRDWPASNEEWRRWQKINRAVALRRLGDYAGAAVEYRAVVALPDSASLPAEFWIQLAMVEGKSRGSLAAEPALQSACQVGPNDALAWAMLGVVQMEQGRLRVAERTLRQACRLDYASPEPHLLLARCYEQSGNHAAALAEVDLAVFLAEQQARPRPWLNRLVEWRDKLDFYLSD